MTDIALPEEKHPQPKAWRLAGPLAVWTPITISLVSLVVSVGTFIRDQRLTALANTANVSVLQAMGDGQPMNGLQIMNDGPAVARLKSITYYVDRKPMEDVNDVIDYGNLGENVSTIQFTVNDTLAAGGREWLISKSTKVSQKELETFNNFLDKHVAVEVVVCSDLTGDCKTICSQENWCK